MAEYQFHYHMEILFSEPVRDHTFTLKCIPKTTSVQEVKECSVALTPDNRVQEGRDSFGNILLYGNVEEEHSLFAVDVTGRVRTGLSGDTRQGEDADSSIYKYHTPLTACGDGIRALHRACRDAARIQNPAWQQESVRDMVFRYMNAVYDTLHYRKGITDIRTSAEEALALGGGVCQDYAHILLSLCREDKIPARYVVGMMEGEGESHAWIEIHDGETWVGFDPANHQLVGESYIKISHGRDYQDCSINRGVFTGSAKQRQQIRVEVEKV